MADISPKHQFIAKRRVARKLALMAAYKWQLNPVPFADIYSYFQQDEALASDLRKADVAYFTALTETMIDDEDAIIEVFKPYLDLPIDQVGPIELSVLLLGTIELKNHADTDYKTSVNEWVNLCKKFGPEQSFKFINGVLDKVSTKMRPDETGKNLIG